MYQAPHLNLNILIIPCQIFWRFADDIDSFRVSQTRSFAFFANFSYWKNAKLAVCNGQK